MVFRAVRSWTLGDLIVAFIELGVAYTLLCGSAFAFVPSKILSLFGVYLPCPCSGFFGYQNYDLCFHRLLGDWPRSKIIIIQELAKSRFPFDLIWFEHQSCDLHVERFGIWKRAHRTSEFDGEACSSSVSGPTWQRSVENKVVNQKQKSGRRRKRAALGYGKLSSLSSNSTSTHTFGTGVPHPLYDSLGMRSKFGGSFDPGRSRTEDKSQGDTNTPNSSDFGESIKHSFELDGSYRKGEEMYKGSCSVEKFTCDVDECKHCNVGSDANVIQVLEQALEEEKAARAALYQELEQERAAAATAADEAMAMILRLQEDKASIEMEAR